MTSKIKVDNINKVSDDSNIINKCGTTITLGASGDSIALASGASQTGFGRTGTVDWQTGSIKTSTFTAANGEGYFANTSGGAFTMNLPAGSAGAIVSVVDYTNTFQTNNLTISPNGSEKIGGIAADFIASTEGQSLTFVYVDATEGWKNVQDSTSNATGNPFMVATGGTITTCGNCKIHTFTGPGTFAVSQVHPCAANNQVSYMVVAGGGGAGGRHGGGGGAGGFREDKSPITPYTASPLEGAGPITVTATSFPITVGAGGTSGVYNPSGPTTNGGTGVNSVFSTITSAGGGGGGTAEAGTPGPTAGSVLAGGSGGGGTHAGPGTSSGNGNTPPVSPSQGFPGGAGMSGSPYDGGGGGGATVAGADGSSNSNGGAGATTSITGSAVARSGGGGGGGYGGCGGTGGTGGGGDSGNCAARPGDAESATPNTGGGGGGAGGPGAASQTGGTGGSGIVIIRYKFQ
jgi:hypothetical protein